jgi:hypothetical protein
MHEESIMIYQMTVLGNSTRLRTDHTTYSAVITSYGAGRVVEGIEFWVASVDGSEVKAGDKWLRVLRVDGLDVTPGWMAYTHKGVPYCADWREYEDVPLPDPDPTPTPTSAQYIVTVDEATKRVLVKRDDGLSMADWSVIIG